MNTHIDEIDPVFMEGIDAWVYKRYDATKYKAFSIESCLYDMGLNWAKDNKVNERNILTKMLEVKDWRNL